VEGYCIYAYYKMLIVFVGGRGGAVPLIESSPHTEPCCKCCMHRHPTKCYSAMDLMILQFMTVRPLLFLGVAIVEVTSENHALIQLLSALGTISLIIGMLALLRGYHILAEHTEPLFPTKKVLFIKGIVLIMIIQNMVINSYQHTGLFQAGKESLHET
jgi:hypothetical protein